MNSYHVYHCACRRTQRIRKDACSSINPAPASLPCPGCKGKAERFEEGREG